MNPETELRRLRQAVPTGGDSSLSTDDDLDAYYKLRDYTSDNCIAIADELDKLRAEVERLRSIAVCPQNAATEPGIHERVI